MNLSTFFQGTQNTTLETRDQKGNLSDTTQKSF
jgi:hypothetical protein